MFKAPAPKISFTGWILLGLVLSLLALLAGCARDALVLDSIELPMTTVLDRHDTYVDADQLDGPTRDALLLQSAELRHTLTTARAEDRSTVSAWQIRSRVHQITARHDAYVMADLELTDLERRIYLRSSVLLRHLVDLPRMPAGYPSTMGFDY